MVYLDKSSDYFTSSDHFPPTIPTCSTKLMEVLQRSGLMYGTNSATVMFPPTVQRMMASPPELYSCYPFEANTPSRTPTPECPTRSQAKNSSRSEMSSHTTTLQSVLRGEVPAAYSHLASSAPSSSLSSNNSSSTFPSSTSPSSLSSSSQIGTTSMELDSFTQPLLHPVPSPCPSHHSSLSYSPRPQSHESQTSQDSISDMQTEPMDLSCKKPSSSSRKRTAVSAFLDVAMSNGSSSKDMLSSSLPAKFTSSRSSEFLSSSVSGSSFPSTSPSVTSMHSFPPSPGDGQHGEEFSLLRNLLSVGKHNLSPPSGSSGLSSSTPNLSSSDRGCDSPASDSFPRTPVSGNTRVTLAKKNMFPVSARVSDWLVKIVQFAKSIPEFSSLSHNDKITLILHSWSRLMLLYMAESNFQFAVTPTPSNCNSTDSNPSQDEPTMKSVEGVQTYIKKCQQMSVDSKEYEFLRMLVLFNAGYVGLSCPETIDQLNSVVQQLLQQHVRVSRPSDVMHYSRLLMSLPSLYGINSRMLETLFCKHISKNTDMEVLLKELLQNLS